MTDPLEVQDMMAKMVAAENFDVVIADIPTAYFDMRARILALPRWANLDPIVADCMRAHEVGHAKWTPLAGWHSNTNLDLTHKFPQTYKDCLNIIEDVRIERLIKRMLPTFRTLMPIASKTIFRDHFVKVANLDVWAATELTNRGPQDKINVVAKTDDYHGILSPVESSLLNRALLAETWDEVPPLAEELYELVVAFEATKKAKAPKKPRHKAFDMDDLKELLGNGSEPDEFEEKPDTEDEDKPAAEPKPKKEPKKKEESSTPDGLLPDEMKPEGEDDKDVETIEGEGKGSGTGDQPEEGPAPAEEEPELNDEDMLSESQKAFGALDAMHSDGDQLGQCTRVTLPRNLRCIPTMQNALDMF